MRLPTARASPSFISGLQRPSCLKGRRFSSIPSVQLSYDEYIPPDRNKTERPLVILHGLFGSKRNWQSLSKAFMKDLNRPVYTLDLRNHGTSPHMRPMTYQHMAADVLNLCQKLSLSKVSLLGHSMGGKVAMSIALSPETPGNLVTDLIVSDIAPVRAKLSSDIELHIEAMERIEAGNVVSRKQADEILEVYEKDAGVRAFLLTNLNTDSKTVPLKFRVPIDILKEAMSEIGFFPYAPGERIRDGRSLFVKGTRSKYINRHNTPLIKQFFPESVIEELDAGHWVHAERPNEFKELVIDFVSDS